MYNALFAKFTQNPDLLNYLKQTGSDLLAYVSIKPDSHWTTGLTIKNRRRLREGPNGWTGRNRMGELLMLIREKHVNAIFV
jgi:predicted NAD-dependent protein-ADP-ribosyltransferase YbiA (DUF1768 family)